MYQIAVLQAGFVYVGNVVINNGWCTITNAKNIRRWGTTDGLGQLVNGPLSETVLDKVGCVRVPMHALIHLIDVDTQKWEKA